ncbi:MAG: hypothetical protein K6E84_00580 [Lachnospiraceae bacterium]|nr:hypothetical protein [Lachnospiraceae bacterium]
MNENENSYIPFDDGENIQTTDINEMPSAEVESVVADDIPAAPEAPEMNLEKAADGIAETKKRNYERYMEGDAFSAEASRPGPGPDLMPGGFESAGSSMNTDTQSTPGIQYYNDPPNYNIEGLEEPVTMGEWLVTMLLMMVPCVNIILMFVWAFSKTEKKSKSNFFKVELIMMGILLAIYIIVIIFMVFAGVALSRF